MTAAQREALAEACLRLNRKAEHYNLEGYRAWDQMTKAHTPEDYHAHDQAAEAYARKYRAVTTGARQLIMRLVRAN